MGWRSYKEIIEKLANKETRYPVAESERGYLGVKIITSDESSYQYYNIPQGAYIREFTENSPADKAGLVVGDVIIAVNGDEVETSEELIEIVSTYKVGETITVTVMSRDGNEYKQKDVEVTLGAKNNES